jgi:UDP-N-acetylmuramate--alanine ligase
MRIPSQSIKTIHFVGIGGIGMSGIAEVLHNLGYQVRGSDISDSGNVKRLRGLGIDVCIGHAAENVQNAQVVVVSSAIDPTNPEVATARASRVPVIRRADMLAELMRLKMSVAVSGTHGKTTTTSLMASLFDAAGLDATVVNGGIINAYGTNARLGRGEWIVVEADESDGSFMRLPATIAVVTNIDAEHMEFYKTFEDLKRAFCTFVERIPFYGLGVLCIDHPVVREMAARLQDRRIATYGFADDAQVRATNIRPTSNGTTYDVVISGDSPHMISDLFLPMMGQHNVLNSLALIAVARELDMPDEVVRKALATFGGVKRRFTRVGEVNGITVIDDYAHHPVEIRTVIAAAKQATQGRIVAVFQPHRYTRLHDLYNDFCGCFEGVDAAIITPVYSAGEPPIEGVTSEKLANGVRGAGIAHVSEIKDPSELPAAVRSLVKSGDMILCMGAGSITQWAAQLPGQLEALD